METSRVVFYSFTVLSEATLLAYLVWKQWRDTGNPLPSLHGLKEMYLRVKRRLHEKRQKNKFKWIEVGRVENLYVYPIRSMRAIKLDTMLCHRLGPKRDDWLKDRYFAIVDYHGYYIDPDTDRRLKLIEPCVFDSLLVLTYTHRDGLVLDLKKLTEGPVELRMLVDGSMVLDCGDKAAIWLSQYLHGRDNSYRLVTWPSERVCKRVWRKFSIFDKYTKMDTGAFGDGASYTLENQASLDDLNMLMEKPASMSQFKPNIVISGAAPYAEDCWGTIRIGGNIFENVMPCSRDHGMGPFTETGRRFDEELRNKMRRYRLFLNHDVESAFRGYPSIGIHLGLRQSIGPIRIGDPVYVKSNTITSKPYIKTHEMFRSWIL